MTDTIADLLTSIRNASKALLPEVSIAHSNLKESIARILKEEGYISDYTVEGNPRKLLKLRIKYNARQGVIKHLRRVSKPGLRHYVGATSVPRVLGGMGTVIMSTPKGVMTGNKARKLNVGGEVICYVW